MKQKNISRIDTYETPYEIYLVVANKYATLEELKELYTYTDGSELDDRILQDKDGANFQASTTTLKRKSDGRYVILVKYIELKTCKGYNKLLDLINLADHEGCHAMLDIFDAIGADIDWSNQEVFAYNKAWITTKILQTWMNK